MSVCSLCHGSVDPRELGYHMYVHARTQESHEIPS